MRWTNSDNSSVRVAVIMNHIHLEERRSHRVCLGVCEKGQIKRCFKVYSVCEIMKSCVSYMLLI